MTTPTQAQIERDPTIFDVEKGLAKTQWRFEDGEWHDGMPPRIGKAGTKAFFRYVWENNP